MGAPSRYLTPGEQLMHTSRRHTVVLGNSMTLLVVAVALGLFLRSEAHRQPGAHLDAIGSGLAALGIAYFAFRTWEWSVTRYVITNERIVLIEGLLSRRIKALPLRLLIDTTYRRTLGGRILGYCDLELNLSGQPGLRTLTTVPNAKHVYTLVGNLLSGSGPPAAPRPALVTQRVRDRGFTETHPLPPI